MEEYPQEQISSYPPRVLTAVGFEPTPLRTGALSQRLRPLGQTVLTQWLALRRCCCKTEQPHKRLQNWLEEAPQTFKIKHKVAKSDLFCILFGCLLAKQCFQDSVTEWLR